MVSHALSWSNARPLASVLCPAPYQLLGEAGRWRHEFLFGDPPAPLRVSTHAHTSFTMRPRPETPASPTGPLVCVLYSSGSVLSPT